MDPVSVGLLAALAGGAGGELGRQVWAGLSALVRRPFRQRADTAGQVSSAEPELTALEQVPEDRDRAQALSTALAVRAAVDPDFGTALGQWRQQAARVQIDHSSVTNTISGGAQYGPVIQGRDFSGISFTTAPPPAVPTRDRPTGEGGASGEPLSGGPRGER